MGLHLNINCNSCRSSKMQLSRCYCWQIPYVTTSRELLLSRSNFIQEFVSQVPICCLWSLNSKAQFMIHSSIEGVLILHCQGTSGSWCWLYIWHIDSNRNVKWFEGDLNMILNCLRSYRRLAHIYTTYHSFDQPSDTVSHASVPNKNSPYVANILDVFEKQNHCIHTLVFITLWISYILS